VRSWSESEARSLGRGRSRRQRVRSLPESKQRVRERQEMGGGQGRVCELTIGADGVTGISAGAFPRESGQGGLDLGAGEKG
jgi:hypothetical protein